MHAERVILETDAQGRLTQVPPLPPHTKIEAIFLVLEQAKPQKRQPPQTLRGSVTGHGDLIAPAFADTDWEPPA
jgi:hypothetical protein